MSIMREASMNSARLGGDGLREVPGGCGREAQQQLQAAQQRAPGLAAVRQQALAHAQHARRRARHQHARAARAVLRQRKEHATVSSHDL